MSGDLYLFDDNYLSRNNEIFDRDFFKNPCRSTSLP